MTPLDDPGRLAVAFVHVLRLHGLTVPVGNVTFYASALAAVGLTDETAVYWAGRAALVHHHEDVPIYDQAFAQFFRGRPPDRVAAVISQAPSEALLFTTGRYSATEVLRHKDFAVYTAEDYEAAARFFAALAIAPPGRRSRRQAPSRSGRTDLRRTVRRALRTEGEALTVAHRRPTQRPRRVVLICDVSGSMEEYARALLRFAHAISSARQRVEVFALGTRLTRLSRQLRTHDPDVALAAVAAAVPDWSGGTRLGDGLRRFNDEWGMRGLARGALVVVLSDGWDRGDPAALAEQMVRLHRVVHTLVWVNPLKASPGYAPLAAGMAAALPYIDEFIEGHSVAALERLAAVLSSTLPPWSSPTTFASASPSSRRGRS